jgi:hypothetical protein
LSFDVVEMYYPYNGILGRGFLNKFEVVIHQAYLCVKIPATLGVITIWGHQNDGRNLERGHTPGQRNVHALDEAVKNNEVEKQPKVDKEKVNMQPDCDTKRVLLDAMVLDQTIVIGQTFRLMRRGVWFNSSRRTKMYLLGPLRILQVWIKVSSSTD